MVVTPIIKSTIVSFENWGEDYDDFSISVEADIGPENEMGAETFTFHVTSPKRLSHMGMAGEIQLGRGLLIMNEYNYEHVKQRIATLLKGCTRDTWSEVSMTIAKYARWEYDD